MKKSYIPCPYGCLHEGKPREISISGMKMHVKNLHPDKYTEFETRFAELKKQAIIKDSGAQAPVSSGEPPRVDDKAGDAGNTGKDTGVKDTDKGDDKPKEGKSFLQQFDEWCDSPEL